MFFKTEKDPESSGIIQQFIDAHYHDLKLSPPMLEQLTWLQINSVITSQSNVQLKKDPVNIEVKRILSRFYCLTLLEEGGKSNYSMFVQAQDADTCLSESSFNRLSVFLQSLSPSSRECLVASCFITKSDEAMKLVPEERKSEVPADSEQFITYMMSHFSRIFPICVLLSQEAVELLPFAFYRNSHARQMLDMEGGYNMLADLKEAIYSRQITHEQYNLWFSRWVINIAGLDGHVNHLGSIYLTEPVAQCIFALKTELDQLWSNSNHPVIDNYLAFREKQLHVTGKYIAYLGALMRQYSPTVGSQIQNWFENLHEEERPKKIKAFRSQLEQTKVTPTYKPTLLVNLLQSGCTVSAALGIFTEIESQAMDVYTTAVTELRLSENTPLSFRNIAFAEALILIKNYYEKYHYVPKLTLDSGGYLNVNINALQDELEKEPAVLKNFEFS